MDVSGKFHTLATLLPGKSAPGTHWTVGWVGPRPSRFSGEEKNVLPLLGIKLKIHGHLL